VAVGLKNEGGVGILLSIVGVKEVREGVGFL